MEFLGIGPLELLFIIIIALLVLGPKEMLQSAQTIGKILRKILTSSGWREFRKGVQSIQNLPYQMAREAGLDEDLQTISQATRMDIPDLQIPLSPQTTLKTIDQLYNEEILAHTEIITEQASLEINNAQNKANKPFNEKSQEN